MGKKSEALDSIGRGVELFLMDFDEYLKLQQNTFVQYYRCLPTSYVNNGQIDEDGNKGN